MARTGQCYLWVPASFEYGMLVSHRWYLYERNDITMHVQVKDPRNIPTYFLDYPVNLFYPTGAGNDFEQWYRNIQRQTQYLIKSAAGKQIIIIDREEGLTYPHNRICVDMRRVPHCADWYIYGIEADSRLKVNQSDQTESNSSMSALPGTQLSVYTSCNDWPSAQGYTPDDNTYCNSFSGYQQPTELDLISGLVTEIATASSVGSSRLGESSQGDPEVGKPFDSLPNRPRSAPG